MSIPPNLLTGLVGLSALALSLGNSGILILSSLVKKLLIRISFLCEK